MTSASKRLQPTLNSGEELVLLQKLARVRRFLKALRIDRFLGLTKSPEPTFVTPHRATIRQLRRRASVAPTDCILASAPQPVRLLLVMRTCACRDKTPSGQ